MGWVYRELRPPTGLDHVACGWVSDGGPADVLPDGCVDVVLRDGRLWVAGPATRSVEIASTPGHSCGVRFRVGTAGSALGIPVDVVRDVEVELSELWGVAGRRLEAAVVGAPTARSALTLLLRGLAEPRLPVDPLARHAALSATTQPFAELSRDLGVSERQLRRRVERAVGYGPRTLTRVLRLQRFLAGLAGEPGREPLGLGRLAAESGYADQSHLSRECRRLTGRSPAALRAAGATAAGEPVSDAFKTPASAPARLPT